MKVTGRGRLTSLVSTNQSLIIKEVDDVNLSSTYTAILPRGCAINFEKNVTFAAGNYGAFLLIQLAN